MKTKLELISYIRSQLGEPLIQIEVTNDQISQIIDDTVKTYADVAFGDFETQIILKREFLVQNSVKLGAFSNILEVLSLNGKKIFSHHWDRYQRRLLIKEEVCEDLLVVGIKSFEPDENGDYIFGEQWVKSFALAKTKFLWGNIVGKYTHTLVGGASINFDRLISEASEEITRLLEELNEKWQDPSPALVY